VPLPTLHVLGRACAPSSSRPRSCGRRRPICRLSFSADAVEAEGPDERRALGGVDYEDEAWSHVWDPSCETDGFASITGQSRVTASCKVSAGRRASSASLWPHRAEHRRPGSLRARRRSRPRPTAPMMEDRRRRGGLCQGGTPASRSGPLDLTAGQPRARQPRSSCTPTGRSSRASSTRPGATARGSPITDRDPARLGLAGEETRPRRGSASSRRSSFACQ